MNIKGPRMFGESVWIPSPAAMRFADIVTRQVVMMAQEYAMEAPFEVRASIEFTNGITEVNTPVGPVRVVGVLGGPRCFEIREVRP